MTNFQSLHQTPLKIALPPPEGSYDYPTIHPIGFRDQYKPSSVTGCAIGIPGQNGCAFPGGGSLSLPEFTSYKLQSREFCFFVPAGTKSVMFSGYAPQGAQAAFVLRYGSEPVRTAPLSASEYAQAQASEKIDTSFNTLVNLKNDQFVVHDGGGTLRFLGGQLDRLQNASTSLGAWVYVRQLQGSAMYDVQIAMDLDVQKYVTGYKAIQWNYLPNPDPVFEQSQNGGGPSDTAKVSASVVPPTVAPLVLAITLTQDNPNLTENPSIDVWVWGKFAGEKYYRTEEGGWSNERDGASLLTQGPNADRITVIADMGFQAEEFRAFGIPIFAGYSTHESGFVDLGEIWE